jgi:hypothetical protein
MGCAFLGGMHRMPLRGIDPASRFRRGKMIAWKPVSRLHNRR